MSPHPIFLDRQDAGRKLALRLRSYHGVSPVVLGLPRGGVPVAYEVARALGAPLDVCVVRKIGIPYQPEVGIGAVAEGGALWIDRSIARLAHVPGDELALLVEARRAEVAERVQRFRRGEPPVEVKGKTVLVIDDGIATGGTARAALQALRTRGPGRLVLTVPVGEPETLDELERVADEVICLHRACPLIAVGCWYEDFSQTSDDTVIELLDRARAELRQARLSAAAAGVPVPAR